MTTGSEWKAIAKFSLPLMLGMFLQQLYNAIDGIVVGNFAGPTQEICERALAAIGGGFPLAMLSISICIGLGTGGSVHISQLYGAKQYDKLSVASSTMIISLGSLGAMLSLLGYIFIRPIITGVLGFTDPLVVEDAVTYYGIYAIGLVFVYIYNAISMSLRAVGDSKASLYLIIFASILNTALNLLFTINFKWGIRGVAIATLISQAACCVFMYLYMYIKYPIFRIKFGSGAFDATCLKLSLKLGIPATLQHSIISIGNIFMQRLINSFEYTALISAFSVGNRIQGFATVPIFSLGAGLSTFTGQNVGANDYDRVRRGWRAGIGISVFLSVVISILIYTIAPSFAKLFGLSPEATAIAVDFQHFMSYIIFLFAAYQPTSSTLQGAGDAVFSTIGSLVTLTTRVTLAYLLVYAFNYGYEVAWTTIPIGWAVGIILTYARLFSGKWKEKRVVSDEGVVPDFEEAY